MENKIMNNHSDLAISVKNLKVGYGKNADQPNLFENFSYDFKKGNVYGIIGNSGAGKTTLISHLNGLLKSRYGDIYINNLQILSNQRKIKNYKKIRKEVSLVFQNPQSQLFGSSVIKDVAFGPHNLGANKEDARARASACLKRMGVSPEIFEQSPFVLSNGQQRRVVLAGTLAIEPSIFIFDEPTAGLDPAGVRLMKNLITNLKKENKTIIVVSHDVDFILEICDEVILLHDKKILVSGNPYDVFTSPLLSHTHVNKPIIIRMVEQLGKEDSRFKTVFDSKPTDEQQLLAILKPLVTSKGGK